MTRILLLVVTALLLGSVAVPAIALAQPSQAEMRDAIRAQQAAETSATNPGQVSITHGDHIQSSSKSMAVLFWIFAAAVIAGALFVVTRRNLIAAVMGMVGCFLGISAIYMMLYAHFLSVVQMLVYAGAIMVLFVFVVMILNRPEDEPVAPTGRAGGVVGGVAIAYLVGRLVMLLVKVVPVDPAASNAAPHPTLQGHAWGGVKAVGTDLFGPGIFPFEAISILLLLAVVGAIAIARPLHEDDEPGADNEGGKAHGGGPGSSPPARTTAAGAGGHS